MGKSIEVKLGDTVLVPMKVTNILDSGDYPYILGYDLARIHVSKETLERFRKETPKGEGIQTKTYEDGLAEAWEMARKITCNTNHGGLRMSELEQIFGYSEFDDVLANYTPQKAAAKLGEWKDKQEIQCGDVVKITVGKIEGVVSKVKEEGCYVIFGDGSSRKFKKSDIIKTGRTINIEELLAQIGGVE